MITVCFNMLLDLLEKKKLTAKYFAGKYEVSERTIYRYIDVLSLAGVPVFTERGRNGGIQIADNYKLSAAYFTQEELSRLKSALVVAEKLTDDETVGELGKKLAALKPQPAVGLLVNNETFYIEGGLYGDEKHLKEKIEPLKGAIEGCKVVHIEYHSREGRVSQRDVEPHAFVFKNMIWYVYAYCRLKGEFRLFKVNRITKLMLLDEVFERRTEKEFTPWRLDFDDDSATVNLLIKFTEAARYAVEEWLGVDTVRTTADSLWPYSASAEIKNNADLISKLLSLGGEVNILSPSEVKQAAAGAARAFAINN